MGGVVGENRGESKGVGGSESGVGRGAEVGSGVEDAWWLRERIGPLYTREKIFSLNTV